MFNVFISSINLNHLVGVSSNYRSLIIDVCFLSNAPEQFKFYWKYFKKIYTKEMIERDNFVIQQENHGFVLFRNFFDCDSIFMFEFPDEETAFYFKMKFC